MSVDRGVVPCCDTSILASLGGPSARDDPAVRVVGSSQDMPAVYLETTIISYLAARPSRDIVVAGHQASTREWWDRRRQDFELFVSQIVVDEASAGDEGAASRRLALIEDIPKLELTPKAVQIAKALLESGAVPDAAKVDALHVALAAAHGMDFLLTWNCKHIANAELLGSIGDVCVANDVEPPVICTPVELMGA